MSDSPKVSVVIATRNRRALLEEALASVRRQDGVAWEIIVVDDASTDGTPDYLSSLAGVTSLRMDSHGERSRARNRGLAEARGAYVMFLDDDDVLHEGALRILSAALDAHPGAVAAVGARQDWFVGENYRRRDIHPLWTQVRPMFDELLFGWSAVSGQNLFRTALLRQLGGYAESISVVEDRDLWLRIARCGPLVLCPQTVMTYRMLPERKLPANIRQMREHVARRAIRALPKAERRRALILRRCTSLVDEAEELVRGGAMLKAPHRLMKAAWLAPRVILSPLMATWIVRRIVGRAYHRCIKR